MKNKKMIPNLLSILIFMHIFYYYSLIIDENKNGIYLVFIAIISSLVGYLVGNYIKIDIRYGNSNIKSNYNYGIMEKIGVVYIIVGFLSHLFYYFLFGNKLNNSYAESYLSSSGYGFITVFFDFIILGYIVISTLNYFGHSSGRALKFANTTALIYIVFYTFVLLKRRQVLFLLIAIIISNLNKISKMNKKSIYMLGIMIYVIFSIFGRIRNYTNSFGFSGIINYTINNFDLTWLSISNAEGQYISRTHSDVYNYVHEIGHTQKTFFGALLTLLPRKILPFSKPLSFPSWYTLTYYPYLFAIGAGFSGSFVIEQYLFGGIISVIFTYLLIGIFIRRFNKNLIYSNKLFYSLIYPVIVYIIVFLPRFDWGSLLVITIFNILPLTFALKISRRK